MAKVNLTDEQKKAVYHVNGPLIVSAGAGSGKTFMLTQRTAFLFSDKSTPNGPFLDDIDQVCAITFTKKAAAEIKDRIRATLQKEGKLEQALKVDSAWISTIHGMCSRILRMYALDLKLDPAFSVIEDLDQEEYMQQALNLALMPKIPDTATKEDIAEISQKTAYTDKGVVDKKWEPLFLEFPMESSTYRQTSIKSAVFSLVKKASIMEVAWEGFKTVFLENLNVSKMARELLEGYEEALALISELSSASAKKSITIAEKSIEALKKFLELQPESSNPEQNFQQFLITLNKCGVLGRNFGSKETKAYIVEFVDLYQHICAKCQLYYAKPLYELLMELAKLTKEHYDNLKAYDDVLDNDDLLIKTLYALDNFPHIAAKFVDKFKVVMVDEFQDTNQLQINVIEKLTGMNTGVEQLNCEENEVTSVPKNNATDNIEQQNLCTVGDAQQSIYRFQGADVQVYKNYKAKMIEIGTPEEIQEKYVELSTNFRSHNDVLQFVEKIFSSREMFGKDFLKLKANKDRNNNFNDEEPRINYALIAQHPGVNSQDSLKVGAARIAQYFAGLREKGHKAYEMVLLLGKMTNIDVYADALKAEGFDCVISGGSNFSQTAEVQDILCLVRSIYNNKNSEAMFNVLTSDMFNINADDLLEYFKIGIDYEADSVLNDAIKCLRTASKIAVKEQISDAVKHVLNCSGWLYRLQKQGTAGLAKAANILKAVKIIEEVEIISEEFHNPAIARIEAALSPESKQAPGTLAAKDGDAVKIMTIHASKGLEFPIVAVAQYNGNYSTNKLIAETEGTNTEVSLLPDKKFAKRFSNIESGAKNVFKVDKVFNPELAEMVSSANCPVEFRKVLAKKVYQRETAEDMRKLYVALTRAREAALLVSKVGLTTKGAFTRITPVDTGILTALFGEDYEEKLSEGVSRFDYGGSLPGVFERIDVTQENTGNKKNEYKKSDESVFYAVKYEPNSDFHIGRFVQKFDDMVSYSSLHNDLEKGGSAQKNSAIVYERGTYEDEDPDERIQQADVQDLDKATDLGSAFHRLAQFAIETGNIPTQQRVEIIANTFNLTENQYRRLNVALDNWFNSEEYKRVCNFANKRAEVSFCVPYDKEKFLQGEIDLLCMNQASIVGADVCVYDYKTGGSTSETMNELYAKHGLQAQCYAEALKYAGVNSVNFKFIRVERLADSPENAIVEFNF